MNVLSMHSLCMAESAKPHGLHISHMCCGKELCKVKFSFMTLMVTESTPKLGWAKSINILPKVLPREASKRSPYFLKGNVLVPKFRQISNSNCSHSSSCAHHGKLGYQLRTESTGFQCTNVQEASHFFTTRNNTESSGDPLFCK